MITWGNSCPVGTIFKSRQEGRGDELCVSLQHCGDNFYIVGYTNGTIGTSYAGEAVEKLNDEAISELEELRKYFQASIDNTIMDFAFSSKKTVPVSRLRKRSIK